MPYPQVQRADVDRFARVWDSKGLKFILDDTTRQFALDYANQVLKSFVDMMAAQALAKKAMSQQASAGGTVTPTNAVASQSVPEPPKEPSRIILAS